jgi:hypothetical protein
MKRYPLYRRLGGPQGLPGRVRKLSPPPGFDSRTVQSVASHYTDWAIPARIFWDIGFVLVSFSLLSVLAYWYSNLKSGCVGPWWTVLTTLHLRFRSPSLEFLILRPDRVAEAVACTCPSYIFLYIARQYAKHFAYSKAVSEYHVPLMASALEFERYTRRQKDRSLRRRCMHHPWSFFVWPQRGLLKSVLHTALIVESFLKMEVAGVSEIFLPFYQIIRHHFPENINIHIHL